MAVQRAVIPEVWKLMDKANRTVAKHKLYPGVFTKFQSGGAAYIESSQLLESTMLPAYVAYVLVRELSTVDGAVLDISLAGQSNFLAAALLAGRTNVRGVCGLEVLQDADEQEEAKVTAGLICIRILDILVFVYLYLYLHLYKYIHLYVSLYLDVCVCM
jgi:hypothetical protein